MAIYEYHCKICGNTIYRTRPADNTNCDLCFGMAKRVWSVQMAPVMQAHFNTSTGTMISDPRQFERELRDKSEIQTERTGIPHSYVPADRSDIKKLGVTDEGLQSTHDYGVKTGTIAPGTKPIL